MKDFGLPQKGFPICCGEWCSSDKDCIPWSTLSATFQPTYMKIEISSNFGRFATSASTEVDDTFTSNEKVVELLRSGLENELFRAGGSAGYKAVIALGGMSLATETEAAKPIDKKTPRSSIPYSTERATALAEAMNKAVNGEGSKLPKIVFSVTGEYEYGKNGTGPSKEAKALWVDVQAYSADRFERALAQLGLDEEYDDEKGEAACHAYLLAEVRKAKEAAKGGIGKS